MTTPQPNYAATPGPVPPAAHGLDANGRPLSDKSKLTAGLLGIFLGSFGVGNLHDFRCGIAMGNGSTRRQPARDLP